MKKLYIEIYSRQIGVKWWRKKTKVSFKVYCPEEKFSEKAQIKISENASHDTSLTVWPLDGRTDGRTDGGREAGYRGMGSNLHGLLQTTWNCNKGFIEHRCVHQMTILKFMQMRVWRGRGMRAEGVRESFLTKKLLFSSLVWVIVRPIFFAYWFSSFTLCYVVIGTLKQELAR